ncbi:BZ3500_MvSof-1268-A1-R1_Chr4-4g07501 [Microbotryum saponariae]|uniref:BZ3500_MvSof-1268-A1-R1_Chr4-4g07501 protein n=1 Tax=Microbotryum saponariae TaxID=289078 RepID=A0A2X0NH93_9BASI|nr:BZ3500_MvSof-1268-A1-R1_Chr4-4g07501 [Microbotryum saponariae]SDA07162.1 BZ3501_MvSof-1269-A2-R1_Chr4-3g07209 [Microbotryum saponariae]
MRTGIVFGLVATALASPVFAAGTNDHMVRYIKRAITPTAKDIEILNFGLTFQAGVYPALSSHFEGLKRFSAEDFAKAGLDHRDRQRFEQIAKEEKVHSRAFEGVLGDNAVSPCKYTFSSSIRMSTAAWFARSAEFIEGIGVGAYQTAIRELSNERLTYAYSAIMAVEARHAAYHAELQGQSGFPVPFETALTYSQAYTAMADFIVPGSCGPKKPLPPLQIFPALYTSPDSQTKYSMGLNFTEPAFPAKKYYAAFLNAGTTIYEPMKKVTTYEPMKGGPPSVYYRVNLPKKLKGVVYIMVTTSSNNLEDSNTVAGPLVAVETD